MLGVLVKKILLANSMVLSVLSASAAYANDKLPERILGRWCNSPFVSTKAQEVYFRPNHKDRERCCCSDMTDGITIAQKGYEDDSPVDDAPSCLFDNIKQKNRDTFLVHIHCKEGDKPSFKGTEEFQLVNGLLFKKRKPASGAHN
jgi:hypothetical protein